MNYVHNVNEDYAIYPIYSFFSKIPSELVTNIPESDLFEILIIDNNINDSTIILMYNTYYSHLLVIAEIYPKLKLVYDSMCNSYKDFKEFVLKLIKEIEDTAHDPDLDLEEFKQIIINQGLTEKDFHLFNIHIKEIMKGVNGKTEIIINGQLDKFEKEYKNYLRNFRLELRKMNKVMNEIIEFISESDNLIKNCLGQQVYEEFSENILKNYGYNVQDYLHNKVKTDMKKI